MHQDGKLAPYQARLMDLWERMVRAIGIHSVNVLMERAIWEASQTYPELALIERGDESLSLEPLEESYAAKSEEEVAEAINALTSALLLILARLLGRDMAQRLVEELETRTSATGEPGEG